MLILHFQMTPVGGQVDNFVVGNVVPYSENGQFASNNFAEHPLPLSGHEHPCASFDL